MNWECPIEGDVWDNPVAALSHMYNTEGMGHGESQSLDREIGFPQPTDSDPNRRTVKDETQDRIPEMGGNINETIRRLEDEGFEVPPQLNQHDLETFRILQIDRGVEKDLRVLREQISYYDRVFTKILENWGEITGESTQIVEEEVEEEDDTDNTEEEIEDEPEDTGGRFSTADVMDREEEEVMRVLRSSTLLDDYSNDFIECFEFVYKKRDTDGVHVDDVADELGIPNALAEENLEELNEDLNLIRHNQDDDKYFVAY